MNLARSLRQTLAMLLLSPGLSLAAGQHAQTLYGEAPKYPEGFSHFDYVNPEAPKGGVIRLSGSGSYDSFNKFISKGVSEDYISLIYDSLTKRSLDEPFTEYGLLADRIERAKDNTWVKFHIREQARFSDGVPVTAEDVVFTFEALISKGEPQYKSYYADVEKAVAESPQVVRFDFKHTNNRELPLIVGQMSVLPKHWWKDRDFSKTTLEPPVGSGAYQIDTFSPGRSIRYKRVKDWWGEKLAVNVGYYNFDAIEVDYYRDNTVALEALKAGHFDFWLENSAKNWATAYDTPAVKSGRLIKEEVANHNPSGMQGFVFNTRRDLFKDARVREALAMLFDFEWANKNLFNGAYTRTHSYFDNSELASTGMPGADELKLLEPLRGQIPDAVFDQPFAVPATDGSGIIRDQQRRAYQLLQEAGWKIEDDRMLDEKGKPVVIEFLLAQIEFERVLLPYKRNLRDLGIELEIRRVDVSQYINRLRSRDYDLIITGFPQSNSPGNEQREYWHSSSADKPGSFNLIGLKDPSVDRLVESLINADSRASLITHTRALDRVLLWGHYVVPNWHIKTWRLAYWDKLEHPATTPPYDYGLMTWWVKPQQAKPASEPQPAPADIPAAEASL